MNRSAVLSAAQKYWQSQPKKKFIPGKTKIPTSGKVIYSQDIKNLIEAVLDGWYTEGRFAKTFELLLQNYFDNRYAILTTSGSSANLLALSALTSPQLKYRQLRPGDQVITPATGFPTTVNPIIQNQLVPVFVDIDLGTYNINLTQLKKAINSKTKAIMMAHTLGNPFALDIVTKLAKQHNLWLIEDCCDALGSRYQGKLVGTFGDIATVSFYPAHHITTGEGGVIITKNPLLMRLIKSFRDWGRDCWCDTGQDNRCGKRFGWNFPNLPKGYDHKYVYSHVGYNLKLTDLQAALGVSQFERLPTFINKRKQNFNYLYDKLHKYKRFFILPQWSKKADPSWFGFLLTIKPNAPFKREELVSFLESKQIVTRTLFAGNLLRHPAYKKVNSKTVGKLTNSDVVMDRTFWIGVYPGINKAMLKFVVKAFGEFLKSFT